MRAVEAAIVGAAGELVAMVGDPFVGRSRKRGHHSGSQHPANHPNREKARGAQRFSDCLVTAPTALAFGIPSRLLYVVLA